MGNNVYSCTRAIRKVGTGSVGIYVGSFFGNPKVGDIMDIKLHTMDDPSRVFYSTKKVLRKGSSLCIILDSDWGMAVGDLVVLKYAYPRKSAEEEYGDPRSKAEE